MNILFDTNIFIDISLKRHPFFDDSFKALTKVDDTNINGFILASTFTEIYYICKKNIGHAKTIDILTTLISTINILGINKDTIIFAIHSNFSDFEDAVQNAAQTPTDFLKKHTNN